RQTRRAAGGRAVVDARHAGRPAGALRTVHTLLLGHLELRQEQVGGQEPAGPSLATSGDREDGGSERRLRPTRVRKAADVENLGRGGPAEGHALPLSESAQSPDPLGRGATRPAEDRRADLYPTDSNQHAS